MENQVGVSYSPTPTIQVDDEDILNNIDGRMHGPMSGFIKKYFGDFEYVHQDCSLEIRRAGRVISRCAIPSVAPSLESFAQWFANYASGEVDGARGSWHTSSNNDESAHDGGTSLLLAIPTSPAGHQEMKWDCVQVIGQFFGHNSVCYQDGLLRLCRSAFKVFASQPSRLFLHGFYIRGSSVELWMFDRSGLYSSDVLNLRKDFSRFLSLILSYQRMTDPDLGILDIIKTTQNGSRVLLDSKEAPFLGDLHLEARPIATRDGVVGTGTVCYRVRRPDLDQWNYVLKLKWRWARDRPEDELLKLANSKGVWGAVSLDYYNEVETTANLRRGLRWGPQRRFSRVHRAEHLTKEIEQREETCDSTMGFFGCTEQTDNFFQNRILTFTLTSPVGRPLHTFQSSSELLGVFRDAIKCHKSLYFDAIILHRDISPGNIIILGGQHEEGPKGILIDLDSALELKENTEAEDVTGTRPFMAIGVLKSEPHTYRHDLESFLYVFLWTIITNHMENPPEASKLRQWSNGEWEELALLKALDMSDGFPRILQEFPPEFQSLIPLAKRLRQLLFPLKDGVIWTGTESSQDAVDMLYDEMISAFDNPRFPEH